MVLIFLLVSGCEHCLSFFLLSYALLFHAIITHTMFLCKVYKDGTTTMSIYERKSSLREFYGMHYASLIFSMFMSSFCFLFSFLDLLGLVQRTFCLRYSNCKEVWLKWRDRNKRQVVRRDTRKGQILGWI
jgi:hypothetical protein